MTLLLIPLAAAGCELQEVTVAIPQDVLVAEVYLRVEEDAGDGLALLHWSGGTDPGGTREARIEVTRDDGARASFEEVAPEQCHDLLPEEDFFTACFRLPQDDRALVRPGARFDLEVSLPGGESLEGRTTVPGDFELLSPRPPAGICRLSPRSLLPLEWTPSSGVWAYIPEVELRGIRAALEDEGIEVVNDPLILLGLAISEADTSIVFPSQFGLFRRFSGDRDLLLALQEGLPSGVRARVLISALDRNATNWSRGGSFNPSGQVRTPSLFGDGTGVFASLVIRDVEVEVEEGDESNLPSCS
jgi:hypothetical protein